MSDRNKKIYNASSIVRYYQQLSQLQPAERIILEHFRDRLPNMKMLDIGIGGGRTTKHFAPLVKEYVGIDYSADMITACRQEFVDSDPNIYLEVVDARDMNQFADNYFDFILFSFNGIDYVNHSDRLKILQEVQRVGKSGCYCFFSSHNLQSMEREFNYRKHISFNPFKTYVNLAMFTLLRLFNLSINLQIIKNSPYLILRDESHNFRLQTYYIRPQEQIKQLASNFRDIKIYSWQSGQQIIDLSDSVIDFDMWLYYLCTVN